MGQCKCTALSFCDSCRLAFETGPVAADPYAAHREREADARKFWTEELGLAKRWRDQAAARVVKCEDELRRLG